MGTSLRELVKKFKYKVLVLLKLLLLEKRVIFFGYPVETLCTYQYSLMSLVPGLLKSLQDAGSPLLDSEELYMQSMSKTPAQSTDKLALFKYLGLPLHIFGQGSFFQPYLPLQQIDILQDPRTRSYIIGTTNAIFLHNRDCATDVIVSTEPGTVEFLQDSLASILGLTSADRRWMDEIIEAVNDDGVNDAQTEYTGSDDYLRAKFEEYILTLLSSVKHSQFTQADETIEGIANANDRNLIADYGIHFVTAWQQTPSYQLWNDYVDWELLNEIVAPGHPCQGNVSLAHVQRRLANHLKEMRIEKNFQPLKQSFSRAMTNSKERLSNVFDSVWQEFEKLQPEEGALGASLEPAIYTARGRRGSADGKGLIQSASSNPVPRPASRSNPDPELTPEDELHDAIIPPPLHKPSLRTTNSAGTQRQHSPQSQQQRPQSASPRPSTSTAGSPVASALSSTLGPATAATAALGQKAAGMFSNVSSFFQAKKKELIDAQREAEEQYQQRIHQHERKQKVMQERARATASTFAVSPKPSPQVRPIDSSAKSLDFPPSSPSSPSTTSMKDIYAYVTPRSAPPRSPTSPKSPSANVAPSIGGAAAEVTNPNVSALSATGPVSPPIVAPTPTVPKVASPTLMRGEAGDRIASQDQECQQDMEKELLEALESNNISSQQRLSPAGPMDTPTRSLTPAEAYSPFSEISVPSSPTQLDLDPLAGVTVSRKGTPVNKDEKRDTETDTKKEGEASQSAHLSEALPIP
ncbi:late secretory pathway protein avl9 [Dissophora globulifera]|uniref:Late secretory pathway protein avl9 n=1 Tax=Dissophora globulifera TaxID=979702 RepID=A0A9P6RLU7_9FUNG|nr:late secretory pathway protein avl9 [Dissophora globulifera]